MAPNSAACVRYMVPDPAAEFTQEIWWSYHLFYKAGQGRPLADWTDRFQSGPAPKGAPRFAYKLTLSIESVCVVPAREPQYFLNVPPVAIENHRK